MKKLLIILSLLAAGHLMATDIYYYADTQKSHFFPMATAKHITPSSTPLAHRLMHAGCLRLIGSSSALHPRVPMPLRWLGGTVWRRCSVYQSQVWFRAGRCLRGHRHGIGLAQSPEAKDDRNTQRYQHHHTTTGDLAPCGTLENKAKVCGNSKSSTVSWGMRERSFRGV